METNQAFINELLKEKKRLTTLLGGVENLLESYGYKEKKNGAPISAVAEHIVGKSYETLFAEAPSNHQRVLVILDKIKKGDTSKISATWHEFDRSLTIEDIKKKVGPAITHLKSLDQIEAVPGETGEYNATIYRKK